MATSTIQHPQATEPLTKPPIAATAQPPSIRAGGGGDSSIAPHPDAPKTKSESNCIVRCFVGIKNQIVRFFAWICSLFSSGSKKLTEEEKKAENKKQMALEEAGLKKKLAESGISDRERAILQTKLTYMKVVRELDDLQETLKERYKGPVSTDEQAMLYLFDIVQIKDAAEIILSALKMDPSNPNKQTLSSTQKAIKHVKDHFEHHKSLRKPDDKERPEVIGQCLLPLAFFEGSPIYEDLLKFVSKMRGDFIETERAQLKEKMDNFVVHQIATMLKTDVTLKEKDKQAKVRAALEAIADMFICAMIAPLRIAQMMGSITHEEDMILFLFHLNKIIFRFIALQQFIDERPKGTTEELLDMGEQAKEVLVEMEKELVKRPPKTISTQDRELIKWIIVNPTDKKNVQFMEIIQNSLMKTDLLRMVNTIRDKINPKLPKPVEV